MVATTARSRSTATAVRRIRDSLSIVALLLFFGGCGGDDEAAPPGPAAPASSPQSLIREALQAGHINHGTSILYRAYASVEDPRLPPALRGGGVSEEDLALALEIRNGSATFAPELLARLRPFMLRPAHPDSIYNAMPLPQPAEGRSQARATRDGSGAPAAAVAECRWPSLGAPASRREWVSVAGRAAPVRVWFSCTGHVADDDVRESQATAAIGVVDRVWGPMVELMGEPILDAGGLDEGGDGSIDIYLVDTFGSVTRGDVEQRVIDASGTAIPAPPFVGNASSAYIILPRFVTSSPEFHLVVIHELFHVLQFAHNILGLSNLMVGSTSISHYWFVEASATWAEAHFERELRWTPRAAEGRLFRNFAEFQKGLGSLHRPMPPHRGYERFIWPYFMEQEAGKKSIAKAWKALRNVSSWDAANAALDSVHPFATHFHTFAVRNVNDSFMPGDPLPRVYRHAHNDILFPDNMLPHRDAPQALVAGQKVTTTVALPSLSARYLQYTVDDSQIQQLVVDFSSIAPAGDLDADALLKIENQGWVLRNYTNDRKLIFCVTHPDERVRDLWLVLSNHAQGASSEVTGEVVVTPLKTPCGCGRTLEVTKWRARVHFEFVGQDKGPVGGDWSGAGAVKRVGHASFDAESAFPNPSKTSSGGLLRGTFDVSDTEELFYEPNRARDSKQTLEGSGPPAIPSMAGITVDGVAPYTDSSKCTYDFHFSVAIVTVQSSRGATWVDSSDVATLDVLARPVLSGNPEPGKPIVLAGTASIPAYHYLNASNVSHLSVYGLSSVIEQIHEERGEDRSLGQATVTWEFVQMEPPPFGR